MLPLINSYLPFSFFLFLYDNIIAISYVLNHTKIKTVPQRMAKFRGKTRLVVNAATTPMLILRLLP